MAQDMFVNLGSNKIKGESVAKGHVDEIDVLAWSWGMSQTGTTHMSTGGGAGKVNVQDLSFTKYVDSGTAALVLAVCKGTHIDTAKLTVRKASGDAPLEYLVIEMKDCIVTSVSTGGSGGEDRLTENVTLNFASFKLTYQKQDPKGAKLGGANEAAYDIAKVS